MLAMPWRTLIVEDEPVTMDALRGLLDADQRFEVVMALRDARWLFELARHTQPEVVLLDVQMTTGPSGLQALPELRAALPTAVIVMHTVYSNADACLEAGADAHLRKGQPLIDVLDQVATVAEAAQPRSVVRRDRRTSMGD